MPRVPHSRFHLILALPILLECLAPQTSLLLLPGDGATPTSPAGHLAMLHDRAGAHAIDDVVSAHVDTQFLLTAEPPDTAAPGLHEAMA